MSYLCGSTIRDARRSASYVGGPSYWRGSMQGESAIGWWQRPRSFEKTSTLVDPQLCDLKAAGQHNSQPRNDNVKSSAWLSEHELVVVETLVFEKKAFTFPRSHR